MFPGAQWNGGNSTHQNPRAGHLVEGPGRGVNKNPLVSLELESPSAEMDITQAFVVETMRPQGKRWFGLMKQNSNLKVCWTPSTGQCFSNSMEQHHRRMHAVKYSVSRDSIKSIAWHKVGFECFSEAAVKQPCLILPPICAVFQDCEGRWPLLFLSEIRRRMPARWCSLPPSWSSFSLSGFVEGAPRPCCPSWVYRKPVHAPDSSSFLSKSPLLLCLPQGGSGLRSRKLCM